MREKTFILTFDPPPPGMQGRGIVYIESVKIPDQFCGFREGIRESYGYYKEA